ncbi:MAG: hypothetical protein N3D14_01790 [Aquificaceae bacterium]|nr:hypothetical protein [Aquificaceae bacterium]MCX8164110.1 hypothetical protein [Aquificaceae bacterium]
MLRYMGIFPLILGVLLLLAGQWMAFEIYTKEKFSKINKNMASFAYGLYAGESLVKLPNPEEGIFLLRLRDGRVIATDNVLTPLSIEDFTYYNHKVSGDNVYIYTKRVELGEYISIFTERPLALGVFLSGLCLFLLGFLAIFKGLRLPMVKQKQYLPNSEELLRKLKAIRTAFALNKIIPNESFQEAKRILDDIIKSTEGRS